MHSGNVLTLIRILVVLISIIPTNINALVLRYRVGLPQIKMFVLTKNIFQNSQNFLDEMFVRSKFFLQFVEEMKKLKLSLSKQHNKMLKIKSEMLKIRKNVKIIKLEKISSEILREFSESRRFSGILEKFAGNLEIVENPRKSKAHKLLAGLFVCPGSMISNLSGSGSVRVHQKKTGFYRFAVQVRLPG